MSVKDAGRVEINPTIPIWLWAVRIVLTLGRVWVGFIWFSELGWKLPWLNGGGFGCDNYRFNPPAGQELHGLCDWMQREATTPLIGLYGDFVRNLVIPNFELFAWLTIFTEVFIILSLVLGLFTRLGGLGSALWGSSLLIGLSAIKGENWVFYLVAFILPGLFYVVVGARYQFSVDSLLEKFYRKLARKNKLGNLLLLVSGVKAKPGELV